jgi:hypothetical protein
MVRKAWGYGTIAWRWRRILNEAKAAPDRYEYTDSAIVPLSEEELGALDLFHLTRGGAAAVAKERHDTALRARARSNVAAGRSGGITTHRGECR